MYRYVYVIIDIVYTYMIMHVWTSRMEKQKKSKQAKQSKAKQGKVRQSKAKQASKQTNKQTSTQ